LELGEVGLRDRSFAPNTFFCRAAADTENLIEQIQWERKITVPPGSRRSPKPSTGSSSVWPPCTGCWCGATRTGLCDLDPPTGEQLRAVLRYEAPHVGFLHVDIKKLVKIPACTAETITAQQSWVRSRYPNTPVGV